MYDMHFNIIFFISVQQNDVVKDDPVLREKVEQLQRMMGDRKKRRQNRRQTMAPYIIESTHQENKESICETADILTTKESETLAVWIVHNFQVGFPHETDITFVIVRICQFFKPVVVVLSGL